MDNAFTPPPGQLVKCPHSLYKLTKVTDVLKHEMTFHVRVKRYDGLSIRDIHGNDVGCLAYDLLRYLNRASILQSIVARDGAESMKEGIMCQVRDTNLSEAFFTHLLSCRIGTKSIAECLWRNMTTAVDNGMKKVVNILRTPSGDVARFLPHELMKIYKKKKEKTIFAGVRKLFLDTMMLPLDLFPEYELVDMAVLDNLTEADISKSGIFKNFFDELTLAQEYVISTCHYCFFILFFYILCTFL
jgi:hypothetical protein